MSTNNDNVLSMTFGFAAMPAETPLLAPCASLFSSRSYTPVSVGLVNGNELFYIESFVR